MKAGIGGGGRASDRHLEAEAALHQHRPLRRRDAAAAAAAAPESRPKPGDVVERVKKHARGAYLRRRIMRCCKHAREGRAIDGFPCRAAPYWLPIDLCDGSSV